MKRVSSLTSSFVLLILLFGGLIGCSKSTNEPQQEQNQGQAVGNSVNYSMAQPIDVPTLKTEKEFEDFIANSEIAVVKFGAEWCGPCCDLSPELRKQAGYFATENVKFAEIDVDALDALATRMNVSSIPDVRVYYEGRPYSQIVGNDPDGIANLVNSLCANKPAVTSEATQETQAPQGTESQDDLLPMLKTEDSYRSFVKTNPIAVVKFGAGWCPPCRKLIPELRKQAEYYKDDVKFAEIDVDDEKFESLCVEFKIESIPLVQIYKDGELQNSVLGYDPDGISKEIAKLCQKEPLLTKESNSSNEEIDDDKPLEDELWPEDAESNNEQSNDAK